jgi:hypothetical protein
VNIKIAFDREGDHPFSRTLANFTERFERLTREIWGSVGECWRREKKSRSPACSFDPENPGPLQKQQALRPEQHCQRRRDEPSRGRSPR